MEGCTLIELATLISVVRLEDNAYGAAIREDIEGFRGQPVPLASVYAALGRLEQAPFEAAPSPCRHVPDS
jgi:DNA-binding PadR family transcriptional regulator